MPLFAQISYTVLWPAYFSRAAQQRLLIDDGTKFPGHPEPAVCFVNTVKSREKVCVTHAFSTVHP